MRLTQNKIEEILVNLLGEEGRSLIRYLGGRENVSEFDLANKTKKDIKLIRKMLYILYNHNLVGFTRKKDKQKGWYIYYWTLIPESIKFNYYKMKQELLDRLKSQLDVEKKELFFVCPQNCVRLNFDQAIDFEFHCPECGELITQDDSEGKIKELKKKVIEVEIELSKLKEQGKIKKNEIKATHTEIKTRKKNANLTVKNSAKSSSKKIKKTVSKKLNKQ
ncbi:MAG TPA: hypothetical protein VJI98_01590 [Candidatus Nanoarchaeia archaeon]|nr:hypothetical protein [Candidatus Nanoarchaeia archaeon]